MKERAKLWKNRWSILANSDVILKQVIRLQYKYMKHTKKLTKQDSASFIVEVCDNLDISNYLDITIKSRLRYL